MSSRRLILDDMTSLEETYYLQSQNGNIYSNRFFENLLGQKTEPSEFEPLRADVPSEISWCSQAFGAYFMLFISRDAEGSTSRQVDPQTQLTCGSGTARA